MARKRTASSAGKNTEGYPCTLRQLPDELAEKAARHAVRENPANAPVLGMQTTLNMLGDGQVTPYRLTILVSRYWGTQGVNLTVSFLSQASAALKDKILSYLNKWSQYGNVNFTLATGNNYGDVRISLGGGGYWSYLGTDIRQIPKNQPTMNLQGFSLSTPESEYNRVIPHEAGHTLAMPHEHMRAEIINRLDYEKTIAYFRATQGWTRQDVIAQVLTPLEEQDIQGTAEADEDSVMTYSLPGSITKDGRPIKGGSGITARDGVFVGRIYPKKVNPPTDPDEPGTPPTPLPPDPVVIQVYGAKRIAIPGYRVTPVKGTSGEE